MPRYEEEGLEQVGQSCRKFKLSGHYKGHVGGVSCGPCSNWNGERCLVNAYDSVANRMDQLENYY